MRTNLKYFQRFVNTSSSVTHRGLVHSYPRFSYACWMCLQYNNFTRIELENPFVVIARTPYLLSAVLCVFFNALSYLGLVEKRERNIGGLKKSPVGDLTDPRFNTVQELTLNGTAKHIFLPVIMRVHVLHFVWPHTLPKAATICIRMGMYRIGYCYGLYYARA